MTGLIMHLPPYGTLSKLPAGRAQRLPGGAGTLRVETGRLWLTRGADDEWIGAGASVRLDGGSQAVVESWDAGAAASFRWQAESRSATRVLRRGLAAGFGAAAAVFASMARRAASLARRAQAGVLV